ncbi:hypothetical protein LCGC14_2294300, partial [marine sediment metagenome]
MTLHLRSRGSPLPGILILLKVKWGEMKAAKALKLKGSPAEAKTYALKLLSYRARSRKELLERLVGKGFGSSQIKEAVDSLVDAGL